MINDRKHNDIIQTIHSMTDEVADLKDTQPLGGTSFVTYVTKSSDLYDYSMVQSTERAGFRVTFTHDPTKGTKYHIVNMSTFMRIGNPDVMASPYYTGTAVDIPANFLPLPEASDAGVSQWIVTTHNYDVPTSYTFYFKFFFKGTVGGTFSVEHLWP